MIQVGQRLLAERLRKGLTIEDVSKATKIKTSFIQAIEEGEYEKLPSPAYAQGFVRNYAEFLEMPVLETLAFLRRENSYEKKYRVLPEGFSSKAEFPVKKRRFADAIKIILAGFVIFLIYILFQYRFAFVAPRLDVFTPREGAIILSSEIEVSGKTDTNATVLINNELASITHEGEFRKTIILFAGKTTLTVKAVNSFGRQKTLERHVEVKEFDK